MASRNWRPWSISGSSSPSASPASRGFSAIACGTNRWCPGASPASCGRTSSSASTAPRRPSVRLGASPSPSGATARPRPTRTRLTMPSCTTTSCARIRRLHLGPPAGGRDTLGRLDAHGHQRRHPVGRAAVPPVPAHARRLRRVRPAQLRQAVRLHLHPLVRHPPGPHARRRRLPAAGRAIPGGVPGLLPHRQQAAGAGGVPRRGAARGGLRAVVLRPRVRAR